MKNIDDGLTLIDFIGSIKLFFFEIKKNLLKVFIIVLIISTLGFLLSINSKPQYLASSSIIMESKDGGGAMSSALALVSQIGLLSNNGNSGINEDKLLEIIKMESIIKDALFQNVILDSVNDLMANHFIENFGCRKEWESEPELKDFKFTHSKNNLTILENTVFKAFYGKILKKYLKVEKTKSGIILISIATPSEKFSKNFNDCLVKSVSNFYVDRVAEKGRRNVEVIQRRVDSVANTLKEAEFTLAKWKDASNQLVKSQGLITELRLRRNLEVNNSLYIEGVKQLEISKFSLLDEVPFLRVIDQSEFPLSTVGEISFFKGLLGGFMVGCIVASMFIYVKIKIQSI